MKFGLPEKALRMMEKIFQRHPEISCVKVFGSRAIGNYKPHSDIDLVITGDINQTSFGALKAELEELPLPYIFDLKNEAEIMHEGLHEHIKQFGKILYFKKIA